MPTNFPGPYECRFNYDTTVNAIVYNHQFRLSLALDATPTPGEAFGTINATLRNGGSSALTIVCEAILAEVKEIYHTATNFTTVELWHYPTASFASNYVSQYTVLTNTAGVNASASQSYRQDIFTFRSTNGGRAKFDLRHSSRTSVARLTYGNLSTDEKAIVDLLASTSTPWRARDDGYFFQPLHLLGGQNERMFKDVNRP